LKFSVRLKQILRRDIGQAAFHTQIPVFIEFSAKILRKNSRLFDFYCEKTRAFPIKRSDLSDKNFRNNFCSGIFEFEKVMMKK
jgi:hypothetical protein